LPSPNESAPSEIRGFWDEAVTRSTHVRPTLTSESARLSSQLSEAEGSEICNSVASGEAPLPQALIKIAMHKAAELRIMM
jgi:hypothetical protein